jgi:hypothetical protein
MESGNEAAELGVALLEANAIVVPRVTDLFLVRCLSIVDAADRLESDPIVALDEGGDHVAASLEGFAVGPERGEQGGGDVHEETISPFSCQANRFKSLGEGGSDLVRVSEHT